MCAAGGPGKHPQRLGDRFGGAAPGLLVVLVGSSASGRRQSQAHPRPAQHHVARANGQGLGDAVLAGRQPDGHASTPLVAPAIAWPLQGEPGSQTQDVLNNRAKSGIGLENAQSHQVSRGWQPTGARPALAWQRRRV